MILFWLLAAAMLLVILALLLPPLLSGPEADRSVARDHLNISIYRDQLDELEAEHARGEIDDVQLDRARTELKRELLDEVDGTSQGVKAVGGGAVRATGLVIALAIPLLSAALYLQLGETELLTDEGQAELARQQEAAHGASEVEAMVESLAAKLQAEPDNRDGWEMLGRTLVTLRRFADAADAYAQVYRLDSGNPDVMTDLAEALAMRDGGQLVGDPLELVMMALERQPMHEKGLWLAGISAFQNDDLQGALDYWQRLDSLLGPDHPSRQVLNDFMAQARQELGIEAPVAQAPAAAAGAAIEVTVRVAPSLADRIGAGDTLFVFARAVNGPRLPLAIVRAGSDRLPLTVTLDDSLAMAPNFRLSGFDRVNVGARISRSGNATPQPGDLSGMVADVAVVDGASVVVEISEVVGDAAAAAPAAPPAPAPAPQPAAGDRSITVDVSLDPALAADVAPGDTLFVFARAASGPRMPLAIVRATAGELPLSVTLDDSSAMAPNFRLSGFDQVSIGVRVSRSGNATPQPGDLNGVLDGVRVGVDRRVAVTLNERL